MPISFDQHFGTASKFFHPLSCPRCKFRRHFLLHAAPEVTGLPPPTAHRRRLKQISAAHVDALVRIQSVIAPRLSRTDLANVFAAASRAGGSLRASKMTSAPHSAPRAQSWNSPRRFCVRLRSHNILYRRERDKKINAPKPVPRAPRAANEREKGPSLR